MSVSEPMSADTDVITHLAARGDGVGQSGRHYPLTAPGDVVGANGVVVPGPHRQEPPCRHFPKCGGCDLQHVDTAGYAAFLRDRIAHVLSSKGIAAPDIAEPVIVPPRSRIRASLTAVVRGRSVVIGFTESGSHRVVDMKQCEILRPELFETVQRLRALVGKLPVGRGQLRVTLAMCDQGLDCTIAGYDPLELAEREQLIAFARTAGLARLSIDTGYGAEAMWEPEPLTVSLSGVPVAFASGSFLQPTAEGRAFLCDDVQTLAAKATRVADLFSGLGLFALALAQGRKVYAAEAERAASLALQSAARSRQLSVFCEHRDLYRRPLATDELDRFDTVVLDPPRAGAREQVATLAAASCERIVYVSCNPSTFARDAKILSDGGWKLRYVRPLGQFLWSVHTELVSLFER